MQKNDLQAEIKSLQEYRKEAEILIEKINSVTVKMESDVVNDIERIKKQIVEDLNEMFSYVSPDIYKTQSISVKDFVERDEKGTYPLAYFSIKFGQKIYSMDSNTGLTQYEIAIMEDCHSYSAIYADGHWADEYPNVARQRNYGRDNKTTKGTLPVGSVIKFKRYNGEYVILQKMSPMYQFRRAWWYCLDSNTYYPSKHIPDEFEIIKKGA